MPTMTVEFNWKMNDILQELADKKCTTKVDILRRAVAVYKYICGEVKAGGKLVIRDGENILKEIVVP